MSTKKFQTWHQAIPPPHSSPRYYWKFLDRTPKHCRRWVKIKLSDKALKRGKQRIKQITRRSRGIKLQQVIKELNVFIRGWIGYYRRVYA